MHKTVFKYIFNVCVLPWTDNAEHIFLHFPKSSGQTTLKKEKKNKAIGKAAPYHLKNPKPPSTCGFLIFVLHLKCFK